MPIKHLVEIGRVAYVGYGRNAGKPVVIVDVIDANRALVDGPCSKVTRQPIRFKRLRLTKHKLNLDHSAPTRVVKREWEKNEMTKKWKEGLTFKRLVADSRRKDLSDLGRFKVYKLKQKVNKAVNAKMAQLKSQMKRKK
jgi:large subunit ribosomal protein L14e